MRRTGSTGIKLNNDFKYKRKIFHPSWLIAWVSIGIIIGTYLSLFWPGFSGIEWIICSICFGVVGFINKRFFGVLMVLIAGLSFGLWRGGTELQKQLGFENYLGAEVQVTGKVSEDPSFDTEGDIRMKLENVLINNQPVGGKVWVSTNDSNVIKRSDVITLEGKITKGFGTIPAALYQARVVQIERQDYSDVGRDVRDSFAGGIRESVREPEASLGAGFLLGQKTTLPEKLGNDLRLLGLTHIVVASGYNLTILIRFARRFLEKVSRFTALAGSFALVYGFLQITGATPSMSRASLIAGISLFAWYFGRKLHPVVLLSFSAAITIVINPSYAWGDIGWLLSFASFIGVIMFAPLVHTFFWGDKKAGNIRQVFVETASAQLLTLPIIAYVFGQYSPLALLANVLILSFIPLSMALTATAGVAGLTLPMSFASIVGFPAELVLRYITSVVNVLAQLPLASSEIVFSITTVIISYIVIITMMIYMWRRTGYEFRSYNVIE